MRRLFLMAASASLLAACATTPPPAAKTTTQPKASPVARQSVPAKPAPGALPAFGSPEFNAMKDSLPEHPADVSQVPDATPQVEPPAKYGNNSPYNVLGEVYSIMPTAKGFTQTGQASWYGKKFHGQKTSSGERYDMYSMTAAHRNLPLPTYVRVTNKANGKSVIVKVNDRGPFHAKRVMDVSYAAAVKLDMIKTGTATVTIEALDPAEFQAQLGSSGKPADKTNTRITGNDGQFFVQVGAFGGIENATALQARLLNLVYAPVVITQTDGVNRVQVGPFASREDAEKMSKVIRDGSLGEPRIVAR